MNKLASADTETMTSIQSVHSQRFHDYSQTREVFLLNVTSVSLLIALYFLITFTPEGITDLCWLIKPKNTMWKMFTYFWKGHTLTHYTGLLCCAKLFLSVLVLRFAWRTLCAFCFQGFLLISRFQPRWPPGCRDVCRLTVCWSVHQTDKSAAADFCADFHSLLQYFLPQNRNALKCTVHETKHVLQ